MSRFVNYYSCSACVSNNCNESRQTLKRRLGRQAPRGSAPLCEGTNHIWVGRRLWKKNYCRVFLSLPCPVFTPSRANTIALHFLKHPLCAVFCVRKSHLSNVYIRGMSFRKVRWGDVERLHSLSDGCGRSSAGRSSRFLEGSHGWTRNPTPRSPWWISVKRGDQKTNQIKYSEAKNKSNKMVYQCTDRCKSKSPCFHFFFFRLKCGSATWQQLKTFGKTWLKIVKR